MYFKRQILIKDVLRHLLQRQRFYWRSALYASMWCQETNVYLGLKITKTHPAK